MPMTDPIADMLTRIRNGQMAGHTQVQAPYSKIKFHIANILKVEGYLENVEVTTSERGGQELTLTLRYEGRRPVIREVKRVSKPGRRVYAKATELPRIYSDIGIAIISTPNGLMTNKEARKRRLGGEVICKVF